MSNPTKRNGGFLQIGRPGFKLYPDFRILNYEDMKHILSALKL